MQIAHQQTRHEFGPPVLRSCLSAQWHPVDCTFCPTSSSRRVDCQSVLPGPNWDVIINRSTDHTNIEIIFVFLWLLLMSWSLVCIPFFARNAQAINHRMPLGQQTIKSWTVKSESSWRPQLSMKMAGLGRYMLALQCWHTHAVMLQVNCLCEKQVLRSLPNKVGVLLLNLATKLQMIEMQRFRIPHVACNMRSDNIGGRGPWRVRVKIWPSSSRK